MTNILSFCGTVGAIAGLGLLVAAAVHDVMARTVPNRVSALIALCGLVAQLARAALTVSGWSGLGLSLLASVAVFIVAAMMWRRGWMGGGDVKLLAAAALLVPAGLVTTLIMATAISGSVLSLFYLAARRRLPRPLPGRPPSLVARIVRVERWRLRRGGPLPYAVAIASGACFVLSLGVPT